MDRFCQREVILQNARYRLSKSRSRTEVDRICLFGKACTLHDKSSALGFLQNLEIS